MALKARSKLDELALRPNGIRRALLHEVVVAVGNTTLAAGEAKKRSGAIMRLALLKTGLTGLRQILTPRLETSNTGIWIDRHRPRGIILLDDTG